MDVSSYWMESADRPRYPALNRNLDVDVAIVGAGITGLTTAYLLKQAGRKVAVIDRDRVGGVDTMRTTAHVTCVTDHDLGELVRTFGRDHAQAAWDAGLAARDEIDAIVRDERIDCDWTWMRGYKHASKDSNPAASIDRLKEEAALADELGFAAAFVESVPGIGLPGVAFDGQAKIHPGKYLARLAAIVDGDGSFVFEGTPSEDVTSDPLAVTCGPFTIAARYIVIATHTPLMGKTALASATMLQTKLYLYSSYVVAGRLPPGRVPEALYWDTARPYHYARIEPRGDHDFLIFGGEDHKTGQVEDTAACFHRLESTAREWFPGFEITHRWSGQVIETNDGLPFIGETAESQFAATGFAGNGMTFGTVAAMMARDAVFGLKNPWRELFDVGRTRVRGGAWDYLKENVDYPYYMLRDRLTAPDRAELRSIRRGEGRLLSFDGDPVAAWRDRSGRLTLLSPVCPHMGCRVAWNNAEQTWDCPCHGSRFTSTGEVLAGPAEAPLPPFGS